MAVDVYKGREVITRILATQDDNGWWTVAHEITQRRSLDLGEWEQRTVASNVKAQTLNKAESESTAQMFFYLESVKGDLFNDSELLENSNPEKAN